MRKLEPRDLRWFRKWQDKCVKLRNEFDYTPQRSANTSQIMYKEIEEELGRNICPDHPNGCPLLSFEEMRDPLFVIDYVLFRCNIEINKSIKYN